MTECDEACMHSEDHDNEIEALQAELDAYKAHVADLVKVCNLQLNSDIHCSMEYLNGIDCDMARVVNKTPAQSLNYVRAKAVMDAAVACKYESSGFCWLGDLNDYANKLKEGWA